MSGGAKNRLERNDRLVRLALLLVAFSAVSVLVVITVFIVGQGMGIFIYLRNLWLIYREQRGAEPPAAAI